MPPRKRIRAAQAPKAGAETVSVGQCQSITVLKTKPRADEAMVLLKRIATLVAPIMRKHGWTLPLLCEFFPDDAGLLGMNRNRGAQIYIRLRPHHSPDAFYDLDVDLMGTMLHELTHNVHGPHDEKFYKFLDKLKEEYYDLRGSGYSGEGFLGDGTRVGKGVSISDQNLPMHQAKQKALEQAEKRAKLSAVMGPSGGQRLGGMKVDKHRSPREMMALAAERRMRDQKACKHGDEVDVEAEAAKAQAAAGAVAIDIDSDEGEDEDQAAPETLPPSKEGSLSQIKVVDISSSDTDEGPAAKAPEASTSKALPKNGIKRPPSGTPLPARPAQVPKQHDLGGWSCPMCTFDNLNPLALQCEVCATTRPMEDDQGWRCSQCATRNEHTFWSCRTCSAIKSSSARTSNDLLTIPSGTLH